MEHKFKKGDKVLIVKGEFAGPYKSNNAVICNINENGTYNVMFSGYHTYSNNEYNNICKAIGENVACASFQLMFQDLAEDYLYENIQQYDNVEIINGEYKGQVGELGFIDRDNMCTVVYDNNEKIIKVPITNLHKIEK